MSFFRRLFARKTEQSAQQYADQMVALNQHVVDCLQIALFKHCFELVGGCYQGMRSDPIAAHMKLTCTGEGPNKTSLANSTDEERAIAKSLAAEVMQAEATGF